MVNAELQKASRERGFFVCFTKRQLQTACFEPAQVTLR